MISTSDRHEAVKLIQEANTAGARIIPACKEIGISVRTYERWTEKEGEVKSDCRPLAERPKPRNKLSEDEVQAVVEVVNDPEFASQPPSQIVPKLADRGVFLASESTFYRILRMKKQNHHRGRRRPPVTRRVTTYIANRPNQVWTWDITWLPGHIKGVFLKLYMILDIFSRKIVAWEVWEEETEEHAIELICKATIKEEIRADLVVHSDNGSPMKGATFQETLIRLGIERSYSRPRVSNDNPYSESSFRTLKYRPDYQHRGFKSLLSAREWVQSFVNWYNEDHQHSGIGFVTPSQRHNNEAEAIQAYRREVYRQARLRHPERWTRDTRRWSLPDEVALNPEKKYRDTCKDMMQHPSPPIQKGVREAT